MIDAPEPEGVELHEIERELGRVVDRLNSMPLARAAEAADVCHRTAEIIVDRTREVADDIPDAARLPRLAPHGLGALVAVVGHDYLAAARASGATGDPEVLAALVALRRALP